MNDDITLELIDVTKQYNDHRKSTFHAVKNVNIRIASGECIGIVGESGCGKSTIAKMISHLTPVTSGKMIFKGEDSTALRKRERIEYYKKVQLVFQDPLATFSPRMKVGSYLIEPFINFKVSSKKEALAYAKELLEMVGLEEQFMDRYPHELSGGQLQRVVIARAVGLNPELIICDECTSALDATIQHQLLQLLMDLRKKTNFSCIFITHDLAIAESFCDSIYVMYQGEIIEKIQSRHLKRDAQHPYTKKLLDSVIPVVS